MKKLLAMVFFPVLLSKWLLVYFLASNVPYNDIWHGVIQLTLLPYLKHQMTWQRMFAPYAEHRMLFQRIYDISLFILTGRLDLRLQCYINAIFYAGLMTLFCWMLIRSLNCGPSIPARACLLAGLIPWGWENTICAFQSQQYFLLLGSLITVWLLSKGDGTNAHWNLGLACAVGTIFTLGSGFLCAFCVIPFVLNRPFRTFQLLIITALGLYLRFGFDAGYGAGYPDADNTHAQVIMDVALAFGKGLAFPCIQWWWLAPLMVLPWLAWCCGRTPAGENYFIRAMGLWVVLQTSAWAFARGLHGNPPESRHCDLMAMMIPLSLCCLFGYRDSQAARSGFIWAWSTAFTIGTVILLQGDAAYIRMVEQWPPVLKQNTAIFYRMNPAQFPPQAMLPWVFDREDFWKLIHDRDMPRIYNVNQP